MVLTVITSVGAIPCWVDLGRDLWASFWTHGQHDPSNNPWIYSIVAASECVHLILMFFGLSAAYDESVPKSIAYAIITGIIALSLFAVCYYIHVIVTIVCQVALCVGFGYYAYELNCERKCYCGRSTPLI